MKAQPRAPGTRWEGPPPTADVNVTFADASEARIAGQDAIDEHVANVMWEAVGPSIGMPRPTDIAYVGNSDAWVDDVLEFARDRGIDVNGYRDLSLDKLDAGRLPAEEDL